MNPEQVVAAQLDAYNARNIEQFVQYWAEDVQVYQFPNTLLFSGLPELRRRHEARFQEPDLHAELLHRRVIGNWVFDQERVTRNFPEGRGTLEVAAVYDVQEGKIRRAWFVFGEPVLNVIDQAARD